MSVWGLTPAAPLRSLGLAPGAPPVVQPPQAPCWVRPCGVGPGPGTRCPQAWWHQAPQERGPPAASPGPGPHWALDASPACPCPHSLPINTNKLTWELRLKVGAPPFCLCGQPLGRGTKGGPAFTAAGFGLV